MQQIVDAGALGKLVAIGETYKHNVTSDNLSDEHIVLLRNVTGALSNMSSALSMSQYPPVILAAIVILMIYPCDCIIQIIIMSR
jgi:hypothetical protein